MNTQKNFFMTGKTQSIQWRLQQLRVLKESIIKHKQDIIAALQKDLQKPITECLTGEITPIITEIDYFLTHLTSLARPQHKHTPLLLWPAQSALYHEPYGVVLILAPWNFPFQLTFVPLIGALAAGNCAVIKPSEYACASSALIARIILDCFPEHYVTVHQGDATTAETLLSQPFDYIFFTGSTRVGKLVMQKAARQLIPVTLELGGKSPCIIDESANYKRAAKRIAWAKYYNAGQNCVAPDYVLIHHLQKERFISYLIQYITEFYGENPEASVDYARIVSNTHMQRLTRLLTSGNIVFGGHHNEHTRYIAPTIIDNVTIDSPLMQEEIFGPLLPIMSYETIDDAIKIVQTIQKPLALYLFTNNKTTECTVMRHTQSGSVTINDAVVQAASPYMPFGGIGLSGMGRYHGAASFKTFSYERSFLKNSTLIDNPLRYAPYTKLKNWIIHFF